MNNSNQPTILVKKADGTSVRMTLSELNEMKKNASEKKVDANISFSDAQKQVNKIALERRDVELKDGGMQNVKIESLTMPKKPEVSPMNGMSPLEDDDLLDLEWKKDDHQSLLEETPVTDLPMIVQEGSNAVATKENTPFAFPDKLSHADITASQHIDHKPHTPEQIATEKAQSERPVANKAVKQEPRYKAPSTLNFDTKPIINAADIKFSAASLIPSIKTSELKPVISDVKPPDMEKRGIGPIDELNNFSITDFRRLGANSDASGAKLLDKFKSLEKDSYLLFMEGVEAWYNSPLYKQYQEIISSSLKQGKTLGQFLAQNESQKVLRLEEFKSILKINQAIR